MKLFPDIKRNDIWQKWHNKLAKIDIKDNLLYFENIRDMDWENGRERYFDDVFDLKKLEKVVLYSIPFGFRNWFSHLILEFKFSDNKNIFLSVEARRQQGEWFSILKWLIPHYGLIFILGTENDLIWLRRNVRKDKIYSYELNLDLEKAKKWLLFLIQRTNKLIEKPEYYNALTSNCTTNLYDVLKKYSDKNIKLSWQIFLSAFAVDYLKKYGYIK